MYLVTSESLNNGYYVKLEFNDCIKKNSKSRRFVSPYSHKYVLSLSYYIYIAITEIINHISVSYGLNSQYHKIILNIFKMSLSKYPCTNVNTPHIFLN